MAIKPNQQKLSSKNPSEYIQLLCNFKTFSPLLQASCFLNTFIMLSKSHDYIPSTINKNKKSYIGTFGIDKVM